MNDAFARPPARRYDYERDPAAIYRQSFAIVRAEADLDRLPESLRDVAVRLIHACGEPDIVADLAWSDGAAEAAREALGQGAPILTDVKMVEYGIIRSRLAARNEVVCTLDDPRVADHAGDLATTRSAAAVDFWQDRLAGAVVAIGNAPTALFHLLERIAEGFPRPAVILGFPVGFVGAAESKQALSENPFSIPYLTLKGRRGGSAIAAAAVNALAAGLPEEGR
ncbi:precorrin-8X methylmutase [Stappia sp. F7233]|uniref:Precorrin-8X methylmutase n=1 Tax=Stappia albiluteola TaxID=2758565 RepID=A0A839A8P7_9HYPH|nr:precorrin-8X methylmutase [Stappia albiluteola]MBA5775950.1 precorrin-8X methylmutase [Stappia albiluteola]